MAAPPVLEFDITGNFLRAWGGAGDWALLPRAGEPNFRSDASKMECVNTP